MPQFIAESGIIRKFEVTTNQFTMTNLQQSTEELWKPIPCFENLYEVSNMGNVKSCKRYAARPIKFQIINERILKPSIKKDGYKYVVLRKDNKSHSMRVHRLVMMAFIANPENKRCVNHIDNNPSNNKLSNLEWATHSENMQHALNQGRIKRSSIIKLGNPVGFHMKGRFNHWGSKRIGQYDLFNNLIKVWPSIAEVDRNNISKTRAITESLKGRVKKPRKFIWKYL